MLSYLSMLDVYFGPFRLFDYVTFRAGGALLCSMMICVIFGPATVRFLKKLRATAPTRLEGLVSEEFLNKHKDKTPSMGGILIVSSIFVSTILWADLSNSLVLVFLSTLISLAFLGFIDDYAKIARFKRDGIPGRVKLFFQFMTAFMAVYYLDSLPETGDHVRQLMMPFYKYPIITMSFLAAYAFGAVVVVGASNAVNLTDGKDGLAAGCAVFCALTYATFAYVCGHRIFAGYLNVPFTPGSSEVVVFASAVAGSCIGFLWHNCHPASMFMGDTGSLPLGGAIGLLAVLVKQEITLIVVGGVFVMEAASVIIQVLSFKIRKKRVFLCAPIHHHFEQKGWTETQIVARFWIIGGICALIGLATLKLR
jgi:phospho-N-acetylmuramoyl-pentapeptide-transferase